MKPFSVFIIRQEKPIDSTNGHHVMPFDTQGDAIAYAKCEMEKGYERAVVIQWTRKGQRRISTFMALSRPATVPALASGAAINSYKS